MSEEQGQVKECTECCEVKPLTEFSTNGRSEKGTVLYRSKCKPCRAKIGAERYHSASPSEIERRKNYSKNYYLEVIKDKWYGSKTYYVYYLPQHHYIGMTKHLKQRMHLHYHSDRFVNDFEIVGEYKTAVEAHLVETQLHYMGYEGFRY